MKRVISVYLILLMVYSCFAVTANAGTKELLPEANEYIYRNIFQEKGISEYYEETSPSGILQDNVYVATTEYPVFVYGNRYDASVAMNAGDAQDSKGRFRAFGFTYDGASFTNPNFDPDFPFTQGTRFDSLHFVETPWKSAYAHIEGSLVNRTLKKVVSHFNYDKLIEYDNAEYLRKYIAFGAGIELGIMMDSKYANQFSWEGMDKDSLIYCRQILDEQKGRLGMFASKEQRENTKWEVIANITQPPTDKAWGTAVFFHRSGTRYFTIPIPPTEILDLARDLDARFTTSIDSVLPGNDVTVGISVGSTYQEPIDTVFAAVVVDSNGNTIEAKMTEKETGKEIELSPDNKFSGIIRDFKQNTRREFEIKFEMPETNVKIEFMVNTIDGTYPDEGYLGNNVIEMEITSGAPADPTEGDIILKAFMLTKKIAYALNEGNAVSVNLGHENWIDLADGKLEVPVSNPNEILKDYNVDGSGEIKEDSEIINRFPVLKGTINRLAAEDDPANENWGSNGFKSFTVTSTFGGSVSRTYEYTELDAADNPQTHTETVTESFNGSDNLNIRVDIYNGRANMPHVAARDFKTIVENNETTSLTKNLFWESEEYTYKVQRYMADVDVDDNAIDNKWEAMPGKYTRIFSQQNSATITYTAKSANDKTMSNLYKYDRDNAYDRKQGAKYYPRVPFATDKDLRDFAYPFKSGYYFNPAGNYVAEVETVVYTNDMEIAKKHHDNLVQAVKDSFYYKSALVYLDNRSEVAGMELTSSEPEFLGKNLLEVKDEVVDEKSDPITYYSAWGREMSNHLFWRQILEGYEESNTRSSYTDNDARYIEYVRPGEKIMYKVTKKSKIYFNVNPNNEKVLTHARMRNKTYVIEAGFNAISGYNGLEDIQGVDSELIDKITVNVHGSIYDDMN